MISFIYLHLLIIICFLTMTEFDKYRYILTITKIVKEKNTYFLIKINIDFDNIKLYKIFSLKMFGKILHFSDIFFHSYRISRFYLVPHFR